MAKCVNYNKSATISVTSGYILKPMILRLVGVLVAVVTANVLFYDYFPAQPGTLGFVVANIVALSVVTSFYFQSLQKAPKWPVAVLSLSVSYSLLSVYRADMFDRVLLSGYTILLTSTYLYLLTISTHRIEFLSQLVGVPFILMIAWIKKALWLLLSYLPRLCSHYFSRIPQQNISKLPVVAIFRGVILTSFFALIMLALMSTDLAFYQFLQKLTSLPFLQLPSDLLFRTYFSVGVLVVVLPLAYFRFSKPVSSPLHSNRFGKYLVEVSMLVITLNIIMATFLIIQFPYIFTNVVETQLHQFGVNTYSEYVKRGFGELSLVSMITYIAVAISYLVYRIKFSNRWLRFFNLLLLAQACVFIGSIFRRVYLYTWAHGLTESRIYGLIFLCLILGFMITMSLRHLKHKAWFRYELILLLIFPVTPILVNPQWLISLVPPTVNQEIDYTYLVRTSADFSPNWLTALRHTNNWSRDNQEVFSQNQISSEQVRQLHYHYYTLFELSQRYAHLQEKYNTKPRLFSRVWLRQNVAEKYGYQQLSTTISKAELDANLNRFEARIHQLEASQAAQPLDRSYSSYF